MRLFLLIALLLSIGAFYLWQEHAQPQEIALITNPSLVPTTPAIPFNADTSLTEPDEASEPEQQEETITPQTVKPAPKRIKKQMRPAPLTVYDLDLSLPKTLEPSSQPLVIPEQKSLIIPSKNDDPGMSIRGGIDWDDEENRAKGANISITIPTS